MATPRPPFPPPLDNPLRKNPAARTALMNTRAFYSLVPVSAARIGQWTADRP